MKSSNKVRSNRKSLTKTRKQKAQTKAIKHVGLADDMKQEEKEAESMVISINNESHHTSESQESKNRHIW